MMDRKHVEACVGEPPKEQEPLRLLWPYETRHESTAYLGFERN